MEIVFFVWINVGFYFSYILLYSCVDVVCFGEEIFSEFRNVIVGNIKGVVYYEDLFVSDVVCFNVNNWDCQCFGNMFCQFNWYVFQYQ